MAAATLSWMSRCVHDLLAGLSLTATLRVLALGVPAPHVAERGIWLATWPMRATVSE